MKDKDYIQELFSQKLTNHEVPVRSDLWSGIQSQIGNTATTAASGGISLAAKWAIGIASSVIVASSVVWFSSDENTEQKKDTRISQVEQEAINTDSKEETPTANVPSSNQAGSSFSEERNSVISDQKNTKKGSTKTDVSAAGTVNDKENAAPLILKEQSQIVAPVVAEQVEKVSSPVKKDQKNAAGSVANDGKASGSTEHAKPVVGKVQEWVNVFSPNGDSYNDNFELKTENVNDFSITVLNEKNQVVYTSENPNFKWNGTDVKTGEMVPSGNYGYVVIARDTNGNLIKMFKNLTITR